MAIKNNRRTILTKRILKESLMELMLQKNISQISIKEICEFSDMSRSTFYLHYQDQYDLLHDVEEEALEKTFETLNNLDGAFNTIESIETLLEYIKANKETFGTLLCQSENEDFQNSLLDNIAQHIKKNIPELSNTNNEKYVFTFIMHGSLNILREWIRNNFDVPVKDLAGLIYYLCNSIKTVN